MITLPTHVTLSTEELKHLETTMSTLIQGHLDMSQLVLAGEITGKANWLGHFYHTLSKQGLTLDVESPRVKVAGEEAWQAFRQLSPTDVAEKMFSIVQSGLEERC